VDAIVESQRVVAMNYFEDGSVEDACPPIKALLHIMAYGNYQGMTEKDPAIRSLFTREALLDSDWYQERLHAKQIHDIALWTRHCESLKACEAPGMDREWLLQQASAQLKRVSAGAYIGELVGTLGCDPSVHGYKELASETGAKYAALSGD
jgi:hypothetical protein